MYDAQIKCQMLRQPTANPLALPTQAENRALTLCILGVVGPQVIHLCPRLFIRRLPMQPLLRVLPEGAASVCMRVFLVLEEWGVVDCLGV
jgi:hypothetical protein